MLSVAVITMNEARHIGDCLRSVAWADEIVVVDAGSTDATIEIARGFTDRIVAADWPGYGAQKNRALEAARGDWVLVLDADERATPALRDELRATLPETALNGFEIARRNHFFGTPLRRGRAWPDWTMRLVRRGRGRFSLRPVHERLVVDGPTGRLVQPILHYMLDDAGEMASKIALYSELGAEALLAEGKRPAPGEAAIRGAWAFARSFGLGGGFLDGRAGYHFARYLALTTARKYRRLGVLRRDAAAAGSPRR